MAQARTMKRVAAKKKTTRAATKRVAIGKAKTATRKTGIAAKTTSRGKIASTRGGMTKKTAVKKTAVKKTVAKKPIARAAKKTGTATLAKRAGAGKTVLRSSRGGTRGR